MGIKKVESHIHGQFAPAESQVADEPMVQYVDHVYMPFMRLTEIRIVILEPAMDTDAPLRFSFRQAELQDLQGRYEALSYVWGKPVLEHPLYHVEDGSRVLVTTSLNGAFRRLRHRLDARWLWADAMCINQKDDKEKAVQIPLMVDIYQNANRVLAWLHKSDEAIERAMAYVGRISRLSSNKEEHTKIFDNIVPHQNIAPRIGRPDDHIERPTEVEGKVSVLLDLPYFRRLWIVQEIVLSLEITLICGSSELSWLRFTTGLAKIEKAVTHERLHSSHHNTEVLTTLLRLWVQNCIIQEPNAPPASPESHILDLVSDFGSHECTDPRDRIYAVHALSHGNNAQMRIDYTLDKYETYCKFARTCMVDGRVIEVLDAALIRVNIPSDIDVPSWVPDWTRKPKLKPRSKNGWRHAFPLLYVDFNLDRIIAVVVGQLNFSGWLNGLEPKLAPNLWTLYTDPIYFGSDSLLTTLSDMIRLYEGTPKVSSKGTGEALQEFLTSIWSTQFSEGNWTDEHSLALSQVFRYAYDTMFNGSSTAKRLSAPSTQVVADLVEGYCSFMARLSMSEYDNSYLCLGCPGLLKGDQLVLVDEKVEINRTSFTNSCFRAFVFRHVEEIDMSDLHKSSVLAPEKVFRLVGEAWLLYPEGLSQTVESRHGLYLC